MFHRRIHLLELPNFTNWGTSTRRLTFEALLSQRWWVSRFTFARSKRTGRCQLGSWEAGKLSAHEMELLMGTSSIYIYILIVT